MLGDNISKIRKSKDISLTACAKEVGISRGYLSDIENNIKKNPSIKVLSKLALFLGIPTSELLSTEEKLKLATGSLNEINQTIEKYYTFKDDVISNKELQIDAETNLLINKIKKLSIKDREIVEVLVNQLLKEE